MRDHSWVHDEDDDGWELYCEFCYHWRTTKKNADGSERFYDYIPEEDEPPCTG